MVGRIKSLNGVITSVSFDEAGFLTVRATHPTCNTSSSYVFAPLQAESEDFECDCGEVLLRFTAEEGEEVPDAWEL